MSNMGRVTAKARFGSSASCLANLPEYHRNNMDLAYLTRDDYTSLKRWMDRSAMAVETIFRIYSLYRRPILIILFISTTTSLLHLFYNGSVIFPFVFVAGLVDREDVNGDHWAIISRVSSSGQGGGGSLNIQDENLREEIKKAEGEIVKSFTGVESAASADRETLNEIVALAQEGKIDVFGAYKFDRITRAYPMESAEFFVDLHKAGVTIYIEKEGYLDLNSLSDFQLCAQKIANARERYDEIIEGAKESQIRGLKQGKYLYGEPHFGYTKDDEDNLLRTSDGEDIIPRIFEVYIEIENRSKTVDIINDEFDLSEGNKLTNARIKTVLESRICIGELCHKDTLITEKPEIGVISKEKYCQAQKIADERRSTPTQEETWPEWTSELAKRYNVEVLVSMIGSLQARCRKCDGELIRNGTCERRGVTEPNYECKDCNYQGPLLTQREFDCLHSMAPMRCPECIAVDDFEYEESEYGRWNYLVTCNVCECSFGTDSKPEKYERALEQSCLESVSEDPDVKSLLTALLDSKEPAGTVDSASQSKQTDRTGSDSDPGQHDLFSYT